MLRRAGMSCDFDLAAVETPAGFGNREGFVPNHCSKKLATRLHQLPIHYCGRKNPEAAFLLFVP